MELEVQGSVGGVEPDGKGMAAAPTASDPFITVLFEDGPVQGVLADVLAEDSCDPKYWRFHEFHQRKPAVKILCEDNVTLYLVAWPQDDEGVLTDEDGDMHHYYRQMLTKVVQPGRRPPMRSAEPERSPKVIGEWGTTHMERLDDMPDELLKEAASTRKRKQTPPVDEPAKKQKRAQTSAKRASAKRQQSSRSKELTPPLGADKAGTEAMIKGSEKKTVPIAQGESAGRCDEAPLGHQVGAEGNEKGEGHDRPTAPTPRRVVLDLEDLGEEPGQVEAAADVVQEDEEDDDDDVIIACSTTIEEADAGPSEKTIEDAADVAGGGRSASICIEKAKTARSICRTCCEKIEKDTWRCGFDAYVGGRTTTIWADAKCFLDQVACEYAKTGRGKCRGSGKSFNAGDLKVSFEIGGHRHWWLPEQAASWTVQILNQSGKQLLGIRGLDDIKPEHRQPLMDLLRENKAPQLELRRSPEQRGRRKNISGEAKKASAPSADHDS